MWPKFILVPKSQTQEWPRVHVGAKEPDTRMALFPMGQTQEWPRFTLVPKSQTQEWLTYIYIYIYIVASKLRTPAPMDSKAGTFSVPDTRLFVGHSLVTGRVAPCLRSFWFQRARHKNGPGFILVPRSQTQEWLCFQWARHRNDPGSRWFQRARRRNGSRIKFLKLGWRRERTEGKKREVLHLCRCYTHTHTRPEPGQPWKARGRKKRTHEGQTAETAQGGEGNGRTSRTNLHGETDLTQNSAHT